ncbi:MAG TPA: outer membrane protein transport protein [Pseudomonas sp.]
MYTPRFPLALSGCLLCLTAPGMANAASIVPSESARDDLNLVYQLREDTRIGLHYSFPVEADSSAGQGIDNPLLARAALLDARGLRSATMPVEMNLPQAATLSLYQALGPQWAVLFSAGWQDWSAHSRSGSEADAASASAFAAERSYRDSWHLAIGTQYRASPKLLLQAGVGYDSAALAEDRRTFAAPMRAAWRLASGLSYAYDSNTELNFNYALTWLGDMPGVQGSGGDQRLGAAEEFSNAYFHTVSWSVTWHY